MKSNKIVPASKQSTPSTCCKRYKYSTIRIDQLPHDLYVQVIRCNMGWKGTMQQTIKDKYADKDRSSWVCLCTDADNKLVAVGLAYKMQLRNRCVCDFHVYVRKRHRRRHIATNILQICRQIAQRKVKGEIHVVAHDLASKAFFVDNNLPIHLWC